MAEKDFEIGDLVWAKMKNYPFWPAKIVNPPTVEEKATGTPKETKKKSSTARKAQHYVFFFGSENYAWILDENIVPHSEEMLNKIAKKKSASYVKAIEKIVEENASNPPKPKPVADNPVKIDELSKKSTAVPGPSKTSKTLSNNVEKSHKKLGKSKKKFKKKLPQKRDLSDDESDEDLSPEGKVLKQGSYSSYHRLAFFRPLEDKSIHAQEYFVPPPEPSLDMTNDDTFLKDRNIQPTSKKIGFMGLGIMGQRMVKNLIISGHDVSIFNRTQDKCQKFVDAGAKQFFTPADLVLNCDIIFCCVSGPEVAKTLVFDANGVLQGLENCEPETKGYVEMTAMDPSTSQEIAAAITLKGGKYLEAPVCGSRTLAEKALLVILAAGDRELFCSCESCFFALSKHTYYLSDDVGSGSKMHLAVSTVMGSTYAALAEIMALVDKSGLSKKIFLEILNLGPMACSLILDKGRSINVKDFSTDTSLKYQQKDIRLGLALGDSLQQPLILASAANELYKQAKLLCHSELDVGAAFLGARYLV